MSLRAARGYRAMHGAGVIDGASPHALTQMLFDGALGRIAAARSLAADPALRRGAIDRALAIVQELQSSLRDPDTDPLSSRLFPLYGWISTLLLEANRAGDDAKLDEATRLLGPLRDAWKAIDPTARVESTEPRDGSARIEGLPDVQAA